MPGEEVGKIIPFPNAEERALRKENKPTNEVGDFNVEQSSEVVELRTTVEGEKIPDGVASIESVKDSLDQKGYDLVGDREILSRGMHGFLYKLKVKDKQSGEESFVVEKAFHLADKRYVITDSSNEFQWNKHEDRSQPDPRLSVFDSSGEKKSVLVDYLYSNEQALKDLEGIPGIPENYGTVYDGQKGSSLEQYVEGYDLLDTWFEGMMPYDIQEQSQLDEIYGKLKETYIAASEKGYVILSPTHGVMVEAQTGQPYFNDLHNTIRGNVNHDGPVKNHYDEGLKMIDEMAKLATANFDKTQIDKVKKTIAKM